MQPGGWTFVIVALLTLVDTLYWCIFKNRDERIPPPKGDPWLKAIFSAVGGVVGAIAITRLTGQNDLTMALVGGIIGGRLVGGIIATVAPRQSV